MDNKTKQDHLERLVKAIDKVYHQPGHLIWRGFVVGLASGLGATIGVAIVLALLGLILRALGGLPGIGDWINNVRDALPQSGF